ncbi:ABC transporter A family member 1-like [Ceratina calcarata]|uniref:ABC transporter A family member 1-like n=1 Tax=Ceratina calcarata TaxID=156304 RepID=A0AAJ7ITJ7_9HYME|nr:ABC transporter A family member 1-like [Ceratina calcarata]
MGSKLRTFGLLLYKDVLVRKRHWKATIFLQCLIPLATFILIQSIRDLTVQPPLVINESTYYPIETKESLPMLNNEFSFLYYVPRNSYIRNVTESIRMCLQLPYNNVVGFLNEDEMIDTYIKIQAKFGMSQVVGLVFENYNASTTDIRYKIRHSFKIPPALFQNILDEYSFSSHYIYINAIPFAQLQMCVDETLINRMTSRPIMDRQVSIQRMPYPPYVKVDTGDTILRTVFCMFSVIAFVVPLALEINYSSKEKQIGVHALMAINGVSQYQNLLSWLITSVVFSNLYIIPILILFKNTFSENAVPYLYHSNTFIFWLILVVHIAHLTSFGMQAVAYISNSRYLAITLSIIYTISFSLHGTFMKEQMFRVIPFLGLVFPDILLYRFLEELNAYETQLTGIQWSNMFYTGDAQYGSTGSVGFILIFSLLGAIIYFTLCVFINELIPGKYGVRKEPFFFKYLKKNKVSLDEDIEDMDFANVDSENFEPVTRGVLTPGIQIRNLKKTYRKFGLRKTTVQALRGISIDLYKGQITALLGHNGAGKTTMMSILTGMVSLTEGKVLINGKNVMNDLQDIRNDLSLCPQENIVFPLLTVSEQLEFFAMLKGTTKTRKEIRQNVNVLLEKLGLFGKRNVLPLKLSGGQQRRLCLGMALIGDVSTIILDEPTSGMDPETRRDIWDLILKMRGQKTILISTHSMEEADILGDRIAIVDRGRLKCYGTPMFLKKQYGYGHIEVTLSTKSWCNLEKILSKFDPRTQQISVDSDKIVLSVPNSENLPECLDKVEKEKKTLGVTGIGVSLITLEEVFLKVINREEEKHLNELFCPPSQKVEGWDLTMQMILALYHKKLVYAKKNLLTILQILLIPILSAILIGFSYSPATDSTNVFPYELDMYRNPRAVYSSENRTIGTCYEKSVNYAGGIAEDARNMSVSDALLDRAREDIARYRNNYVASVEFNVSDTGTLLANALYSGTAIHSVPLTINLLSNALIKSVAGDEYSIRVSSQKLPNSLMETMLSMPGAESLTRVLIFCCFFFPVVALFIIHPFEEKETKMKQLQRMTGVSSFVYWLTMFVFDLVILTLSILIIVTVFYLMDVILDVRLYYKTEIMIMILLLMLFGMNSLFVTYIFSFIPKSRNTVHITLSLLPGGLVIVQYLLHEVIYGYNKLRVLHSIQKRLFRLIPYVSVFHGQYAFFEVALQNSRCRRLPDKLLEAACLVYKDRCCDLNCTDGVCETYLPYFADFKSDMNLGECVVYLSITPLLYFAILIMLEEQIPKKLYAKMFKQNLRDVADIKDDQVKKEKHVVASEIRKLENRVRNSVDEPRIGGPILEVNYSESPEKVNDNLFLVYELSKRYGSLVAVQEISFRVKQGECFGLLGVNGAGKSTTFRMLTGEEIPNSGTMYLGRSEIQTDRETYLKQMGYCPQTNAMLNSLNSFDHLRLFAMLRGIPRCKVDLEVNKWINRLSLTACMHQPSSTYSGGNKRRLNIAMALIGNPTLVLLDEPTSGVDPAARRSLWSILKSCQATGQAIILTSHSMEECEALCNRLVIMVKGQLVCIGASQELKQRFGAGYDIHIKLNPSRTDGDVDNIKRLMESKLSCEIRDENLSSIAFHVNDTGTTWEKMYSAMYDLKRQYGCIEDFAVLSATLEQLFIQFARGTESTNPNAPTDSV